MTEADLVRRLAVASEAAWEAGQLILSFYRRPQKLDIKSKGPQDLVTAADLAADVLLQKRLSAAFPEDKFLTEESGGSDGERLWVIDPIDGTVNFARGLPHFCISIAFCMGGRPSLGIIYDPIQDELFTARVGLGATCNGRPMAVSRASTADRSLIDVGHPDLRHTKAYLGIVERLLDSGYAFRNDGSAALGLARVADGRIEGYCDLFLNSWDVLAGLLLVSEAGGWTSDFLAGEGLMRGNAVLACAPELAPNLRRLTGI